MANKFVSFLEMLGKDIEKGLAFAVKYLPAASTFAGLIFPASVAPLAAAVTVTDLIQKAVVLAEQQFAGTTGSGAQKLALVVTLANNAVQTILAEPDIATALKNAGIVVDQTYITNLVNAVVGILNVWPAPATTV